MTFDVHIYLVNIGTTPIGQSECTAYAMSIGQCPCTVRMQPHLVNVNELMYAAPVDQCECIYAMPGDECVLVHISHHFVSVRAHGIVNGSV